MDKQLFVETLSSTKRRGIETVLAKLEELGFYDAPASSKFHLSCKGGLLEHSVNVYKAAIMLREQAIQAQPDLEVQLPLDSVAICTLLHDTCKTDIYIRKVFLAGRMRTDTGRSMSASRLTTTWESHWDTERNPSSCSSRGGLS